MLFGPDDTYLNQTNTIFTKTISNRYARTLLCLRIRAQSKELFTDTCGSVKFVSKIFHPNVYANGSSVDNLESGVSKYTQATYTTSRCSMTQTKFAGTTCIVQLFCYAFSRCNRQANEAASMAREPPRVRETCARAVVFRLKPGID